MALTGKIAYFSRFMGCVSQVMDASQKQPFNAEFGARLNLYEGMEIVGMSSQFSEYCEYLGP